MRIPDVGPSEAMPIRVWSVSSSAASFFPALALFSPRPPLLPRRTASVVFLLFSRYGLGSSDGGGGGKLLGLQGGGYRRRRRRRARGVIHGGSRGSGEKPGRTGVT